MRFTLPAILLLFASATGWSFDTGKEFLQECEPSSKKVFSQLTDTEQLLAMSCGGYIRGFVGALRITEAHTLSSLICSPDNVEIGQALRLTVRWMNEHPSELGRPAVQLIFAALADLFPCSKDSAPKSPREQREDSEPDKLTL